jgi:hypothetical protein
MANGKMTKVHVELTTEQLEDGGLEYVMRIGDEHGYEEWCDYMERVEGTIMDLHLAMLARGLSQAAVATLNVVCQRHSKCIYCQYNRGYLITQRCAARDYIITAGPLTRTDQ